MKEFRLAVLIGRFQPFHVSHKEVIQKALDIADQVLIILGSHKSARTIKNPFTSDERKLMILSGLDNFSAQELVSESPLIKISHVRDYHYSDNLWVSNIQSIVQERMNLMDIADSEVTLIANYKDASSYYLNLFPQWEKTPLWGKVMDATQVRNILFNAYSGTEDIKKYLPEGTFNWIVQNFWGSDTHKQLIKEQIYIENYKRKWENSPFPVTFVTAEAVVIKSGHILMVKRKREPGKGLLALPGGFIKQNERIENAALRELSEETKIDVPAIILQEKVRNSHIFDYPGRSLRGRVITHAYFVDLGTGPLPKVKGSDDAEHAMWVPLADLLDKEEQIFEDHLNIISYFVTRK